MCVFFKITLRHSTLCSNPLDKWLTSRRDFDLAQKKASQKANIHVAGGIRTRYAASRTAGDPRFRQRGHWDRLL